MSRQNKKLFYIIVIIFLENPIWKKKKNWKNNDKLKLRS